MTTVESLEKAFEKLPPEKLAEFRRWFVHFDSAAWDEQIETDAAAGRLDVLAAKTLAEHQAGKTREI